MIISPNLIAAIAKPLSGSTANEGIGRVERRLDSSTFVISLGSNKMTVRVTDGSLGVGQRVNVTARNDTLVIERLGTSTSSVPPSGDSYLRAGAASPRDLQSTLDAIIAELSTPGAGPEAFRRSEILMQAIVDKCSSIDPKLTEAVKQALGSGAAASPEMPQTAESEAAAIELLQRLKNTVNEAETVSMPGRTVTVQQPLPEGLFSFSSVEEALEFLGVDAAAKANLAADLQRALAEDGRIVLRTTPYATAGTAATILRQTDLLPELESLVSRFNSRAFQSIPAEVFERLLLDRGSLSFDLLRLLDAFASGLQLPAASLRAGSREAQEAALAQWLHAAFDSRTVSGSLASLLPAFSASSIIDALEEFSAAAAGVAGITQHLPQPEGFGLTAQTLGESRDRSLLFNLMFKRLGFDFENTLATTGTIDKSGLKPMLLDLSAMLAGVAPAGGGETAPSPHSGMADVWPQLRAALNGFEQECLSTLDKALSGPPVPADNANAGAPAIGADARRGIADLLRSGIDGLARLADRLLSDLQTLQRGAAPDAGTKNAFVNEARARIEALLQQLCTDLDRSVRNALQRAADQSAAPARDTAPAAAKPPAGPQDSLEKTLTTLLFQKIDEFKTLFSRLAETLLRQSFQETGRKVQETAAAARQEGAPAAKDSTDPDTVVRQALRANLDTLVNRFESLQLLARQVPTAGGDQQIVALPVKVGEEWTEMHVRFVRRRGAKGSGQRGHYSVYLNVAPSLLGAINCRLDYVQKKSLSLSVEFESRETRNWFQEHKSELRKSLVSVGLPSPQIEFYMERAARQESGGDTAAAAPDTTIDLKA